MSLRISDQQYRFLCGLLETLRNEIRSYPPISFAEFDGIEVNNDLRSEYLANGVCQVGDRFFYFGRNAPPCTTIAFGPENAGEGLKRLNEIAPKIVEAVKMFSPPEHAKDFDNYPKEDWRAGLIAASLVITAAEQAREIEPESLVLPKIIKGTLFSDTTEGQPRPIYFPGGGRCDEDILHFSDWWEFRQKILANTINMKLLKTPIIQSAAIIVKRVLDASEAPARPKKGDQKRKKQKFFDSGHNETEGEWCDPMPLLWMARAIKQTEETTKRILAQNGLKQKSRENWIARTDTLKTDWSDAIVDAPKNKPK